MRKIHSKWAKLSLFARPSPISFNPFTVTDDNLVLLGSSCTMDEDFPHIAHFKNISLQCRNHRMILCHIRHAECVLCGNATYTLPEKFEAFRNFQLPIEFRSSCRISQWMWQQGMERPPFEVIRNVLRISI